MKLLTKVSNSYLIGSLVFLVPNLTVFFLPKVQKKTDLLDAMYYTLTESFQS